MMANHVVVLEAAVNDLARGMDFYGKQNPGLGAYFFDSLIADIESLEISAGVHAICMGLHRMLSKRFPFAIYYHYNPQRSRAEVLAVLDMRSNPAWAREELETRQ